MFNVMAYLKLNTSTESSGIKLFRMPLSQNMCINDDIALLVDCYVCLAIPFNTIISGNR